MRYTTMLGVLAFALGVIPCSAQYQRNIPPGDYAQTCRDIHTNGNTLEAECQTRDGNWRRTSLDNIDQCSGIVNVDGRLTCGSGGNGYGSPDRDRDRDHDRDRDRDRARQGGIPPGDYAQTCRNIRAEGDRLEAECQRRNGHWRKTSLDDIDKCSGGIINNNGRLMCGTGGNGYDQPDRDHDRARDLDDRGNIPRGTYVQTCRNIRTHGDTLEAECQTRDGDWRRTSLNDIDRCTDAIANDDGHLVCGR
ncbi:MAG TPA: CVNH domain-containing protein [Candidatus Angelobacter sp.]|nr:CVNH domain-containing protein [Candidatus Angelobacter sp.]